MSDVLIDHLPDEVLAVIFASFDRYHHVLRGPALVNKHWHRVSRDPDVWARYWSQEGFGPLPGHERMASTDMFDLFKETVITAGNFLTGRVREVSMGQLFSEYMFHAAIDKKTDTVFFSSAGMEAVKQVRMDGTVLKTYQSTNTANHFRMAFTRDNRLLVSNNTRTAAIEIFDLDTQQLLGSVPEDDIVWGVQCDLDTIVHSTSSGMIKFRRLAEPDEVVKAYQPHHKAIFCMEHDDQVICTGSEDKTAVVIDMESGLRLYSSTQHAKTVRSLQLRGPLLATGSWDNTCILHDLRTNMAVSRFENVHTNNVLVVRFDDYKLCSGSVDRTMAIWDLRQVRCVQRFDLQHGSVPCLDFSGSRMVCGTGAGHGYRFAPDQS